MLHLSQESWRVWWGAETPHPKAVEKNPESGREDVFKYISGTDTEKTLGKISYFRDEEV